MKSSELGQVIVDPHDATDELMAAMLEALERGDKVKYTKRLYAKLALAKILHPLGIHHWVNYRTFDAGSGRIITHPGHWVCANPQCSTGKRS